MNWKLRDGVSWSATDYGGVLLDTVSGDYYQLNPTGAVVLTAVLAGSDLAAAAAALAEACDVDAEADFLTADASAVIEQLAAAELVVHR
ncbi:lasso peptide biosynthesis PqqD family chaperone [Actinoplanes missouriensis]|uniref:lasso peptide biosynthesis PqqD family chaperone n=1 Tax=Actinoplanes missouriensis TaxID=1866 RepID=UPI0033D87DBF